MNNYAMVIQYDGGRYKGWQRLGSGENTIQAKLEDVLTSFVGKSVEVIGCSRTDAGVHALAQVANFRTEQQLSLAAVQAYLNSQLPRDISVVKVMQAPCSFHSRYHARDKTYLYKIWNEPHPHPFMRRYSLHVEQRLNTGLMQDAAHCFLGSHDFSAFSNAKSKKKSMVREIYGIEIAQSGGFILIRIRGNGFLYNMVRKMVGALVLAGLGEMTAEMVAEVLESRKRGQIGSMADACGLYLEKISFKQSEDGARFDPIESHRRE